MPQAADVLRSVLDGLGVERHREAEIVGPGVASGHERGRDALSQMHRQHTERVEVDVRVRSRESP